MNSKQTQRAALLLVLVALPAVYLAYVGDSRWKTTTEVNEISGTQLGAALPELRQAAEQIKRVELARGEERLTIERASTGWVLPERSDYPAKEDAVLDLLAGLSRLELVEPKTARPELFEKLGLVEPEKGGKESREVRLFDAGGKTLGALVIGNEAWDRGFSAVYVRRPEENQCYLAKGKVQGGASLRDYLDRALVTWAQDRTQKFAVRFPTDPTADYVTERAAPADPNFNLAAIPEGKEASSPYLVSAAAKAITSLRFEDVAKAEGPAAPDLSAGQPVECLWSSFDGILVRAEGFALPAEEFAPKTLWVKLTADLEPWAGAPEQEVPSPGVAGDGSDVEPQAAPKDTGEPKLPSREDLQLEVQALNLRFEGWLFKLESGTATSLLRKVGELVKDPAPPPSADSSAAPFDLSGINTSGLDLEQLGMSQEDLQKALEQLGAQQAPSQPAEPENPPDSAPPR